MAAAHPASAGERAGRRAWPAHRRPGPSRSSNGVPVLRCSASVSAGLTKNSEDGWQAIAIASSWSAAAAKSGRGYRPADAATAASRVSRPAAASDSVTETCGSSRAGPACGGHRALRRGPDDRPGRRAARPGPQPRRRPGRRSRRRARPRRPAAPTHPGRVEARNDRCERVLPDQRGQQRGIHRGGGADDHQGPGPVEGRPSRPADRPSIGPGRRPVRRPAAGRRYPRPPGWPDRAGRRPAARSRAGTRRTSRPSPRPAAGPECRPGSGTPAGTRCRSSADAVGSVGVPSCSGAWWSAGQASTSSNTGSTIRAADGS